MYARPSRRGHPPNTGRFYAKLLKHHRPSHVTGRSSRRLPRSTRLACPQSPCGSASLFWLCVLTASFRARGVTIRAASVSFRRRLPCHRRRDRRDARTVRALRKRAGYRASIDPTRGRGAIGETPCLLPCGAARRHARQLLRARWRYPVNSPATLDRPPAESSPARRMLCLLHMWTHCGRLGT